MTITLHEGDNRVALRRLIDDGVRVHSVVTDPPYGLTSVQKRFGGESAAPARTDGNDGSFARLSGGFMGKAWDGTGIERDPEFWRLIWEILLPGGYVFAFSGSRTGHWQACAMEMAGFIMHPMHGWVFGSGFPKAHAADKAIDKMVGAKGSFGEPKSAAHAGWIERGRMRGGEDSEKHEGWQRPWMDDPAQVDNAARRYVPASPAAAFWEGWAYGTQAQKPALEPIYLGQKPFSEKTGAANLLTHGVGAVNIDGCRVGSTGGTTRSHQEDYGSEGRMDQDGGQAWRTGRTGRAVVELNKGRHPANLILDGSSEVVALFPHGKSGTGAVKRRSSADHNGNTGSAYGAESRPDGAPMVCYGDEGSAARFFHQFAPTDEDYQWAIAAGIISDDRGDPLIYNAKAGKQDRAGSKHPTVKPVALMQYLVRHITPPGGTVLDPFAGSGTTAEAARREGFDCILMEAEPEYVAFLRERFDLPRPSEITIDGSVFEPQDEGIFG